MTVGQPDITGEPGKVVSLEARLKSKFPKEVFLALGVGNVLQIAQFLQQKEEAERSIISHDTHVQTIYPTIDAFLREVHQMAYVAQEKVAKVLVFEDQGLWDRHSEEINEMRRTWASSYMDEPLERGVEGQPTLPFLFDILVGVDEVRQYGVSFRYDHLCPETFGLTTIRNNIFPDNYGEFLDLCSGELGVDKGKLAQVIDRERVTVSLSRRSARPSETISAFMRTVKSRRGFAITNYRAETAGTYMGDTQPSVVSGDVLRMNWDAVYDLFDSRSEVGNKDASLFHFLVYKGKK